MSDAKVAERFLEAEARGKSPTRLVQSMQAARHGMGFLGGLGVRTQGLGSIDTEDRQFFGRSHPVRAVELFAGAGGLALGTAQAGFTHDLVVECDNDCCKTMRSNQLRGVEPVAHWKIYHGDVRSYDFAALEGKIDLLAGGPPCQPFSLGGKHKGIHDSRNMFPALAEVAKVVKPRAILIENVKGLLRPSFKEPFEYICLLLRYPDVARKKTEDWLGHLSRLRQHHEAGKPGNLQYDLSFSCLNATDYGVPQRRERVFLVAFRGDLDVAWEFPSPTHSLDALLRAKWITHEYWERHEIAKKDRPSEPLKISRHLEALRDGDDKAPLAPWVTVRDSIGDLPDPREADFSKVIPNHWLNPGARAYHGHTGSPLDEPAKALKAGAHGVPGGENMLAYSSGNVRYFTVRECARLQAFPDEYVFQGSWTECMRQLGNAVPVLLAQVVARAVHEVLKEATRDRSGNEPQNGNNGLQHERLSSPKVQMRQEKLTKSTPGSRRGKK